MTKATVPAEAAWGPGGGGGGGQQLTEGGFTGISFSCSGEKELRFAGILADGFFTAIRQLRLPAAGRRAVRVLLLLLLLPAAPSAQPDGSRMPEDGSGHPDNCHCPAAQPGMWALVVVLGVVAASSLGFILHTELTLRRARKAAQERARERSRAAAWGYPATAPPMPRV